MNRLACLLVCVLVVAPAEAATVSGVVREAAPPQLPVAGARMTVFLPDLSLFTETRSGLDGSYSVDVPLAGTYRVGCAALRHQYLEAGALVGAGPLQQDFSLQPETEPGRWDIIGSTAPEFFDATDIGILLPDGTLFFCHDTTDPIRFDPATGAKSFPAGSPSAQGCMNGSLLQDGSILMAGGQDGADPGSFRNAVRWVKRYSPQANAWQLLPQLQAPTGRWYPGLARLADGSFLIMGGGTAPDAVRTATCERFDLQTQTWSLTGSMLHAVEFPPSALLYTGEVLATWSPPQLYNPATGQWRPTGDFNQPNRSWPGHCDHSLVVLADGRALALGVIRGPDGNASMGEVYDPATGAWSLTSNPGLVRLQTEVVPLPDGRVLVAGGETETSPLPPGVSSALGIVKWTDLYDSVADRWRRVADMNWFREYHAVTLLLRDGRVATTGGTRIKFQYGPTTSDIEAYVPPYLLRGVRPRIAAIAATDLQRGGMIKLTIEPDTRITSVVLMGTGVTTHWVFSGIPRLLVLEPAQVGSVITASLPSDENVLPLGYYMVFAMVDDIPSEAVIVQVTAGGATGAPLRGLPARGLVVHPNVPNQFNPATLIRYELPEAAVVSVRVYNPAGRLVRTLLAGLAQPPGEHGIRWDGRDDRGRDVASGTYLCRVEAGSIVRSRELALVR